MYRLLHANLRHCQLAPAQSASCHQLFVPHHQCSVIGNLALCVAGQIAWNLSPDNLRDPTILAWFDNLPQFTDI